MNLKPWREVIVPHPDVLNGTFQQSEFAADLTAVRKGSATLEYGDAKSFYERTFITEGMGRLLTQVAQRLNGTGGDPVIQLQTAFGGGKTHTMLAVYHLASRGCELNKLIGIPQLLDKAGLIDVPKAKVVVIDGAAHSPGQPWKNGTQKINTLWGELAWQLGQAEGYAMVKTADENGTSPGKNVLQELLARYAPCVILLDELVVYIRQFNESQPISGGTYDSNLSFIQSLTEAVKSVPKAVILASLPESDNQAGGAQGVSALKALEAVFGRVQALWKTVAPEEAFEIVRRRLFERISNERSRDLVCRAFAETYLAEGAKLPQETQEARYYDRLVQSYPIHPEVFAQLYEEWTTIDGFQRTRGVLKLMAKTIFRLWQDDNKDLMILPGSLPLYDGNSRNELIYYLGQGWDPVMDRDIDGEKAETTLLEIKETRFGSVQAARRVARTVFLASAPASVSAKPGARGVDRARIMLGCLQPGQTLSLYSDALNRLSGQLHYMSSSGDKAQENTRYWFDTRANLRREMEERKQRFSDKNEVRVKMSEVVKKLSPAGSLFDGVHVFTPHSDVPDDAALRLVVLSPGQFYEKGEPRLANEAVLEYVKNNGTKPRHRGNRLLFLSADHGALSRLVDSIKTALAWNSIVEDVDAMKLVLDNLQTQQARNELKNAEELLPRIARESFKWLLCPSIDTPGNQPLVEALPLNISGGPMAAEIERVCNDNSWVIDTWSPIHLRTELIKLYWKADKPAVKAADFWEDTLRYLYLPRLKNKTVIAQAINKGACTRDFFGTAYGLKEGKYEGFKLGDSNVQFDDTLLLVEPGAAAEYEAANKPAIATPSTAPLPVTAPAPTATTSTTTTSSTAPKAKTFHGSVEVSAATAKMQLVQIAEEVIAALASDANSVVKVRIEISAEFNNGAQDQTKRAVSENARTLGFGTAEWGS